MKTTRAILPKPEQPFTTARLLLRPLKREDLADYHTLRTQTEVMKWTSTGKIDVDNDFTMKWIERHIEPNADFSFSIEELANPGRVVGSIGLPWLEPPECGYMFRTEAWGKGYATEALVAWLEKYWALPRKTIEVEGEEPVYERQPDQDGVTNEVLRALTVPENQGSRKVLAKSGFKAYGSEEVEDTQFPGEGKMCWVEYWCMERPNSEKSKV
jgi:RimJ/RimL family protein N-acetyltransferase